jgi:hypothetical protein
VDGKSLLGSICSCIAIFQVSQRELNKMNQPLFKKGDKVFCSDSPQLEQPMEILGFDPWCKSVNMPDGTKLYFYHVLGKNIGRGQTAIVTLSEAQLKTC